MSRTDELHALAQRFTDSLPDEVDEVLLTGSVSRGEADELSDVEMLLVAHNTPPRLSALGVEMWQEDFFENVTIAWYTAASSSRSTAPGSRAGSGSHSS
jgi:predicted nucleotidyltransferase